ncbi:hypothetical protein [Deinococcus frigens]|uniref:hypothetical protein n=1 Tax=Deinococcus frigens TaxID=249403 RepID=UPI0012EC3A1D|nr:hypothetical protein [Deinococcus frigens]
MVLAGMGLSVAISAAVALGTQLPVLAREAARNDTSLSSFLAWNVLGSPQPIQTISHSYDPVFPAAALLVVLFVFAAMATRARWPHWLILACAVAGVLTVAVLTNLVLHEFTGFPANPLLPAVCVTALGIVLGLPFQGKRAAT